MRIDGTAPTQCIDCGALHRHGDPGQMTTISLGSQLNPGFACMACGHPLNPNGSCITCNPGSRIAS